MAFLRAVAQAGDPPATGGTAPKGGLTWMQPPSIPPSGVTGPVRGRLAGDAHAIEAPSGDLAGLRAVSLREGQGVVALGGSTRSVRPGDRIGSATVKAIGSDRIILERAASGVPPTTIVVTFGANGTARVRTYAPMGSVASTPEAR
jgi:hypothetical protein